MEDDVVTKTKYATGLASVERNRFFHLSVRGCEI